MYQSERKEHVKPQSPPDTEMLLRKSQLVVLEKLPLSRGTSLHKYQSITASRTPELSLLQAVLSCKGNPCCSNRAFFFGKMTGLLFCLNLLLYSGLQRRPENYRCNLLRCANPSKNIEAISVLIFYSWKPLFRLLSLIEMNEWK